MTSFQHPWLGVLAPVALAILGAAVWHLYRRIRSAGETRLKALIGSFGDLVLEIDGDGVCRNLWTRREDPLGRPRREWIGGRAAGLLGIPDSVRWLRAIRGAIESGRPAELHYAREEDAGGGHFLARIHPILRSGPGSPAGPVCRSAGVTIQETGEREAGDEALRLTQAAMDRAPFPAIWLDPGGRIVYANEAGSESLGYSRRELTAMSILDVDPDCPRERWRKIWEDVKTGGYLEFESRHRRKNGETFVVEVSARYLQFSGREYAVAFERDIAERRQTGERMRTLSLLVENSADFVAVASLDGTIQYVNPAGCRLVGLEKPLDAVGREILAFHPESEHRRIQQEIAPWARRTTQWQGELQLRHFGSGAAIDTWATVFVISRPEGGEPLCLAVVMRDVTTQKAVEAALRGAKDAAEAASSSKSAFLANMSHEIRTPMNGILGMIGLMLDDQLSARQRQRAEIVLGSAETLLSLLNDILDLSRIEARKIEIEAQDFDLRSVVELAVDLMAVNAQKRGLELLCLIEPEVVTRLRGDASRLRQVLLNLIGNAVKFTERGEVSIRVRPDDSGPPCRVRFEVRDTGIGIPESKAGLLFRPFSQVDASTTRHYGGTGLGLSIVKGLVEMMGGQVGFETAAGQGSLFWFTAQFQPQPVQRPRPLSLAGRRVLAVDGNSASRKLLCELGSFWRARFEGAGDVDAAFDCLRAAGGAYDAVICALETPGGGAQRLLALMRQDSLLCRTPVILLTPSTENAEAGSRTRLGFAGHASKPVKQGALGACLASLLGFDPMPAVLAPAERAPMDRERRAHLRILLVEDNDVNREVALGILATLGYRADVASDGREAIRALVRKDYDLVLMDCQLPELDGYEATRVIRQPNSPVRNHDLPVIALTAHAMAGDREKCLAAGMNGYIAKPLRSAVLEEAIEQATGTGESVPRIPPAAAVPHPVSQAVFDDGDLVERLSGNEDLARRLVGRFLESFPQQLENLSRAIASGDADAVTHAAHSMKGAAANTGGNQLREMAWKVEQLGRAGDLAGAAAKLPDFSAGFEAALPVMKRFSSGSG